MKKNDRSEDEEIYITETQSNINIPDDLVQIQAYVRWEKAGKPNYSPEQQQVYFKHCMPHMSINN